MKVAIVMGSTSDLEVMKGAMDTLDSFGIEYEKRVISAHRAPDLLVSWARGARQRGVDVIIAGAGGAAHLAGVIAGLTSLPVIGVPIMTKGLGGLDSLLSIVQMPSGIPVATVAIGGAKNAAILAVEMFAISDQAIRAKLDAFRLEQTKKIENTEI